MCGFNYALRPGGPRYHNAAASGAISLRSISACGEIAPAKAAYVMTVIFIKYD